MKILKTLLILFLFTIVSCRKEPSASISADKGLVEINEPVSFTNNSVNGDSYSWDFGDHQTSEEVAPKHSWSTSGDYVVTLTVYSKRKKVNSVSSVNIRVTDYAYKYSGLFSGVSIYQSTYCGSGTNSNNIQVSAPLSGNDFSILNLDNKFSSIASTVSGPGNLVYIMPQTGIYANDGTQWDMDTIKIILSGSNSLIITYSMNDMAYGNTCGYHLATLVLEK